MDFLLTQMDYNDFKSLSLREIKQYRDNILRYCNETYTEAENAVENLFSNKAAPDVLQNLDDMNRRLKMCREKLATLNSAIPIEEKVCKNAELFQVSLSHFL